MSATRLLSITLSDTGPFTRYKLSRYASEFFGTFTLLAAIKLIVARQRENDDTSLVAFGIGLTLLVIVSMYGHISLAQFNPSVTIGFVVRNYSLLPSKDYPQWIIYILMQFFGAICGGYFSWLVGGAKACKVYTFINIEGGYTAYNAFFGELFFTIMLVSVNLHVASDKRLSGNQIYPAAIGMLLTVSILSIGKISGSAVNTAVWVGTVSSAAACMDEGESLILDYCWIYWVAHLLAGILSGLWFRMVYGADINGVQNKIADKPRVPDKYNRVNTNEQELRTIDADPDTDNDILPR